MVIQTANGWILDVSHDYDTDDINLLIKLQDGKVISFKQKLKEHVFYLLPRSYQAGQDLYQQLSRNDQLIKRIFWNEKFIDLQDKIKTNLIGISLESNYRHDIKTFIQKLGHDSRVKSLYNIDISDVMQFIYTQLKIPPTSKVKIRYDDNDAGRLLSISKIDDSQEISSPPFSIIYIEATNATGKQKFFVRTNGQTPATALSVDSLSDPQLISFISQNNSDIIILCGDFSNTKELTELSKQKATIRIRDRMSTAEINLIDLIEKSRVGYLPLRLASKYGMIRLIDSRITFELLQRDFVIPERIKTVSKHHEQIRTLESIVSMDKAGIIISPEIGLHENVAVLDFNDEYANIITGHNISYENQSSDYLTSNSKHSTILPTIVEELVRKRVYLKQFLKTQQPDTLFYSSCEARLDILKQILVCLYGTSGSIWNRYSNVQVFEKINRLARQVLVKTKDIVQRDGFELIYADTDAVFLKKKDATRKDFEKIMEELVRETGLQMTLEFHYKFLVLLYIEADEKMEAKKHYFGLTYDNQLITRGIDTRRHDSPAFIKEFQTTLLSKLFGYHSSQEVLTTGYQNALLYITQSIDKLMNGEVQITDLVISKLLRQNIEKYRSLFPHVSAAIRLNVSGVIANRGDNIQYVYTDSKHTDPLYRITPAKLISSNKYDKEKYLEMLLDSAEAVLSIFGFNRTMLGFDKKFKHWYDELYQQRERDIESAKTEL
jgi:DNA polymerase elongation subunit (family B)